jgi:hypothetical protein
MTKDAKLMIDKMIEDIVSQLEYFNDDEREYFIDELRSELCFACGGESGCNCWRDLDYD